MEPLLEHSKIVLKLSLSAYAEVDDFLWGDFPNQMHFWRSENSRRGGHVQRDYFVFDIIRACTVVAKSEKHTEPSDPEVSQEGGSGRGRMRFFIFGQKQKL